jgi:hypothetical protein
VEHLPEVASRSDFLAVTLPLTPKTRGLVGDSVLQAMKRDSVLINLSRGTIVDERALVKAITKGPLRGAVRTRAEPFRRRASRDIPNVITSRTRAISRDGGEVADLFCENSPDGGRAFRTSSTPTADTSPSPGTDTCSRRRHEGLLHRSHAHPPHEFRELALSLVPEAGPAEGLLADDGPWAVVDGEVPAAWRSGVAFRSCGPGEDRAGKGVGEVGRKSRASPRTCCRDRRRR